MPLLAREKDTIAAIATPVGPGGIGIIKISGQKALSILNTVFEPKNRRVRDFASHRMYYGWIRDREAGESIDECMAVYMKAPNTYTREDVVELQSHSGTAVLRRVLELVLSHGARLAEPGEFTKRAFLNGRIDLRQAEAVMDLINAQTERERAIAFKGLSKGFHPGFSAIRASLLDLLAYIEVAIDFPDEDVDILEQGHMEERLKKDVIAPLEDLILSYARGRVLREGAVVVFAGRPNVGKSSIFNALLGMNRVIVSPVPGTTRDVVEESIDLEGLRVILVDTAGIREPGNDIVERSGIELAMTRLGDARAVLVVLDLSEGLKDQDISIFSRIPSGKPFLVLFNKGDLVKDPGARKSQMERALRRRVPSYERNAGSFIVSAETRAGLESMKKGLLASILSDIEENYAFIPNLRQKECLAEALLFARRALSGLRARPLEISAMDIRDAIKALDRLTGKDVQADLLDRIFSSFCLGK